MMIKYWECPFDHSLIDHNRCLFTAFHCSSVVSGWWSIVLWSNRSLPKYFIYKYFYHISYFNFCWKIVCHKVILYLYIIYICI